MTKVRFGDWVGGFRKVAACSTLVLASILAGTPSAASTFRVDPVQLNLAADQSSTSLSLKNADAQSLAIRAQTFRWTQKDGKDVYEPTSDVIVSPPIFTVPVQGSQLVRIGMRKRAEGTAYRVILEEIPRAQAGRVNVALRLNLPLYVLAAGSSQPVVHWAMWQNPAGEMIVEGTNSGSLHLQVTQIDGVVGSAAPIPLSRQMGVVLPASARQWNLGKRTDLHAGTPVVLKLQTSMGPVQAPVVLEKR